MAVARVDKKTGKLLSVWNEDYDMEDGWSDWEASSFDHLAENGEGPKRIDPIADDDDSELIHLPGKKRTEVHEEMQRIADSEPGRRVDVVVDKTTKTLHGKAKRSFAEQKGKKPDDTVTFADLEAMRMEQGEEEAGP